VGTRAINMPGKTKLDDHTYQLSISIFSSSDENNVKLTGWYEIYTMELMIANTKMA